MGHLRQNLHTKNSQVIIGLFLALCLIMMIETVSLAKGWTTDITSVDGTQHITVRHGKETLKVVMRGDIQWLEDESGIASMDEGSLLILEERSRSGKHRLEVRPKADGTPEYNWTVGRKEQPFDAGGEAWLKRMLPQIYRSTGFDADNRVARLLAQGGLDAALDEVGEISRDNVQRLYLVEILEQIDPTADGLTDILRTAAREVGNDYELRQVMAHVGPEALDGGAGDALLEVAREVGNDHELRRMLETLLDRALVADGLTVARAERLVDAAHGIGNDHELAQFVGALNRSLEDEQGLPSNLPRLVRFIDNDYELRRTLVDLLQRPALRGDDLRSILDLASQGIGNDHELARVLVAIGHQHPPGEDLMPAVDRALGQIGNDHERSRAEDALGRSADLAP